MKVNSSDYRVPSGDGFKLANRSTHVVPADDKETARLIVSKIVIDALEDLKMSYPETTAKRRAELKVIRKTLEKQ